MIQLTLPPAYRESPYFERKIQTDFDFGNTKVSLELEKNMAILWMEMGNGKGEGEAMVTGAYHISMNPSPNDRNAFVLNLSSMMLGRRRRERICNSDLKSSHFTPTWEFHNSVSVTQYIFQSFAFHFHFHFRRLSYIFVLI